jgi:hypothetical protein
MKSKRSYGCQHNSRPQLERTGLIHAGVKSRGKQMRSSQVHRFDYYYLFIQIYFGDEAVEHA